jgi:hypothetical protein
MTIQLNFFLNAAVSLFQIQHDFRADVRSALTPTSPSPSKQSVKYASTENIAESIKDILDVAETRATPSTVPDTRVTVTVVACTFFRIVQHFIGFGCFFKQHHRFFVVGIAIRMVLDGQLAIGRRDLAIGRVARDPKYFVVASFAGHGSHITSGRVWES